MYMGESVFLLIILVHLATIRELEPINFLSPFKSQVDGRDRPVSDSLIPDNLLIFETYSLFSSSSAFILDAYGPFFIFYIPFHI